MRIDLQDEFGDIVSLAVTAGTYVFDYLATIVHDVIIEKVIAHRGECKSFVIHADFSCFTWVRLVLKEGDKVYDKKYHVSILPWEGFLNYAENKR